jgi:hypothetical protein
LHHGEQVWVKLVMDNKDDRYDAFPIEITSQLSIVDDLKQKPLLRRSEVIVAPSIPLRSKSTPPGTKSTRSG